ncbi:hypothetical protein VFPPC_01243 [Pochonia chlamydosporia 170]|uniref:GEgh16 protein n=1 Tax=Pochonia chlamydosporia 170 TaxID=1380566 RepID=A0A179G6Y9_METCM|nr:hypothetical protein VFPPC_01243 [Pochonia chlamydosporia 170]OAQ73555.1 hypothetical protein VFPPC_01243 [Pochonia chlamydosporia 170]
MRGLVLSLWAFHLFAISSCHSVILNVQGIAGSPASVGFQVDPAVARNCITINPCQQDTTIIRDAEINANVVNKCGRTQLKGNIDVGENIQIAISKNAVTQVKAGTELAVTIHQVNADGAGPYVCDVDQTGNSGEKFDQLNITNNVPGGNGLSLVKTQAFNMTVKMPDKLSCTGGSTGNICTVRCRNASVAGPFGGCFVVQQVDTKQTVTTPASVKTGSSLKSVLDQVKKNQADFQEAVKANKAAGSSEAQQNLAAVNALLANGNPSGTANPAAKPTGQNSPAPANNAGGKGNNANKGNNGSNANKGNNAGNGNNGNNAGQARNRVKREYTA